MKKEDILSLFVYLIMVAVTVILAFTVVSNTFPKYLITGNLMNLRILWGFVFLLVGIILNSFLIEAGHILGAKLGRYEVYSVNVLFFNFFKKDNKWKFRFHDFDGLTGETKIKPRFIPSLEEGENTSKRKTTLGYYCSLPFTFFILIIITYVILSLEFKKNPNSATLGMFTGAFFFFLLVGSIIQFYNIFPAKLDGKNDGYVFTLMTKKENKEVYDEFLMLTYNNDYDIKIEKYKVFNKINNFTAEINLYAVYDLFKQKKFQEAEGIIDLNLDNINNISQNTYYNSLSHKIFILLSTNRLEECKTFCESNVTKEYRHYLNKSTSAETVRAYILVSGLVEDSESETRNAIAVREKAIKHFSPLWKETENELFDLSVELIDQKHPEWKIKETKVE